MPKKESPAKKESSEEGSGSSEESSSEEDDSKDTIDQVFQDQFLKNMDQAIDNYFENCDKIAVVAKQLKRLRKANKQRADDVEKLVNTYIDKTIDMTQEIDSDNDDDEEALAIRKTEVQKQKLSKLRLGYEDRTTKQNAQVGFSKERKTKALKKDDYLMFFRKECGDDEANALERYAKLQRMKKQEKEESFKIKLYKPRKERPKKENVKKVPVKKAKPKSSNEKESD